MHNTEYNKTELTLVSTFPPILAILRGTIDIFWKEQKDGQEKPKNVEAKSA
jgi:hypothetical protein